MFLEVQALTDGYLNRGATLPEFTGRTDLPARNDRSRELCTFTSSPARDARHALARTLHRGV
jgi:hypothetical protein